MNHILSLNIRGLGNASKTHCLKDILYTANPIIFLGQETMCARERAIKTFLGFKAGWNVVAVDAVGLSGGLIAIWNPDHAACKAYKFFGGILLSGQLRGMEEPVNIINIYAPYCNRIPFWQRMMDSSILSLHN